MKKLISFFFLLISCNTIHCMELAPQQGKLKSNEEIIREIITPFLDFTSKVNLGKTCRAWYQIIKPTALNLSEDDCKNLNIRDYTFAMFYYAQKDTDTMMWLLSNTNETNREETNRYHRFITGYSIPFDSYNEENRITQLYTKHTTIGIRYDFGFDAAYQGCMTGVLLALKKKKFDINSQDNAGNSLLHYIKKLDTELGNYLLQNMNNINLKNNLEETPLHYSIKNLGKTRLPSGYGNHQLAGPTIYDCDKAKSLLIDPRIDVNAKNNKGETPLHYATDYFPDDCSNINDVLLEIIECLLKHPDIKINTINEGKTPLDYAYQYKHEPEKFVELLRRYNAMHGSFFQNHKTMIQICSLFGILGLIGTGIFAYFHHNSNPITQ